MPTSWTQHCSKLLMVGFALSGLGGILGCATSTVSLSADSVETVDSTSAPVLSTPSAEASANAASPEPDANVQASQGNSSKGSSEHRASQSATTSSSSLQEDSIEPANLETILLRDLHEYKGQPYSEVRSRLLDQGWLPHDLATNGPPSDFNDPLVQAMEGLGFQEVKACSGTGQGFCRFEFVYQERTADFGPVLVITTAATSPADSRYPEPTFWDFNLEKTADLTYLDRSFDQALFSQLRNDHDFCRGVGRCDRAQYMLNDALLLAGSHDFGTTQISLIPIAPVSKATALAYARILDADGIIDFEAPQVDEQLNIETYDEADIPSGGVEELGGVTTVKLTLTPTGMVSEISFSNIVL